MKRITILASILLAISCAKAPSPESAGPMGTPEANATVPAPEVSTESPDAVVRSYWALQDWLEKHGIKHMTFSVDSGYDAWMDARKSISGGEFGEVIASEEAEARDPFKVDPEAIVRIQQRDILEVKNESETRALVLAKIKNITPLPRGYELNRYSLEKREYGVDVRYVVEKIKGEWRLTQAWYRDSADAESWTKAWEIKPKQKGPSDFTFFYVDH